MDARARDLIATLQLSPHPEGGHYRELYRSSSNVDPRDDRGARRAMATVYFLLAAGEASRWHRVRSDEVWHHFDGAPLTVWTADAAFTRIERHVIGAVGEGHSPEWVVPAGTWQAAESQGAHTLVGCVVAPGFDFADFTLLSPDETTSLAAARRHPDAARFI